MNEEKQQAQAQKPKELIWKKWWFWAIITFLFISVISSEDDESRERRLAENRAREESRAEERLEKEAEKAAIKEAKDAERLAKEVERANEKAKEKYRNEVVDIMLSNTEAANIITDTFIIPSIFWTQKEVTRIAYASVIIHGNYLGFKELTPPKGYEEHYSIFLAGLAKQDESIAIMRIGIDNRNSDKMKQAANLIGESLELLNKAEKFLK